MVPSKCCYVKTWLSSNVWKKKTIKNVGRIYHVFSPSMFDIKPTLPATKRHTQQNLYWARCIQQWRMLQLQTSPFSNPFCSITPIFLPHFSTSASPFPIITINLPAQSVSPAATSVSLPNPPRAPQKPSFPGSPLTSRGKAVTSLWKPWNVKGWLMSSVTRGEPPWRFTKPSLAPPWSETCCPDMSKGASLRQTAMLALLDALVSASPPLVQAPLILSAALRMQISIAYPSWPLLGRSHEAWWEPMPSKKSHLLI